MEEIKNLDLEATTSSNTWGIDKKIPVALILVVVFQTVAITWGAATLSSDVRNGLVKIDKLEENLEKFVEKAERKYATRNALTDLADDERRGLHGIKNEIQRLDARVRDLEKNIN